MLQKYPVEFLEVLSVKKTNLDMHLQSSMEDICCLPFVTSNLNVFSMEDIPVCRLPFVTSNLNVFSMEDICRLPFVTTNLNVLVLCTFRKGCELRMCISPSSF
jgi:hypothetical protein